MSLAEKAAINARPTNELPSGVMCRRDGSVYQGEVRVGHVEKSAESGLWRAKHADGREVVASFSPKVVDFATRRGAVEAMLKTGAGAG